jgi:hypothetical protein
MFFVLRQRFLSVAALCIITFASISPFIASIASPGSAKSFVQEICSKNGDRFLLSVVTTKGNLISTLIDVKGEQEHSSLTHQFDHCPLCSFSTEQAAIIGLHVALIFIQSMQASHVLASYHAPSLPQPYQKSHPTRAPPVV